MPDGFNLSSRLSETHGEISCNVASQQGLLKIPRKLSIGQFFFEFTFSEKLCDFCANLCVT